MDGTDFRVESSWSKNISIPPGWEDDWIPRYNIAPTQPVPVIRQHPRERVRQVSLMKWGLIPHWTKHPSVAASTINAKSETAATRPAFGDPLKLRRCLIPADAFYEWKKVGNTKQPYCFEVNDGQLFSFAGLWDGWKASKCGATLSDCLAPCAPGEIEIESKPE